MKILIIDDEEDICMLLKGILEKYDNQCEAVKTLIEAKNIMKRGIFDLFFLDINLPDGSGFELIPFINENNTDGEIVMVSAYDGDLERNRALAAGIKTFISKPFDKSEILEVIR
jgi:two-component system copper resistance phosphate regulon response regulator CusR